MTLALIPARGGSKGIPRKNVRNLAGKPLIAWTIEAALDASRLERVVVSTDDDEIAAVARDWGADVPFMRPAELATDEATGFSPVLHALEQLPGHDDLILLQPTSPLRGSAAIDAFLAFAHDSGAPAAVSLRKVADHPAWMFARDDDGRLDPLMGGGKADRRQELQDLYILNGAMYWGRSDWLAAHTSFVDPATRGFVMEDTDSVDIDTMQDWALAEAMLARRQGTEA